MKISINRTICISFVFNKTSFLYVKRDTAKDAVLCKKSKFLFLKKNVLLFFFHL